MHALHAELLLRTNRLREVARAPPRCVHRLHQATVGVVAQSKQEQYATYVLRTLRRLPNLERHADHWLPNREIPASLTCLRQHIQVEKYDRIIA